MNVLEPLRKKASDADFDLPREGLRAPVQAVMEAEVAAKTDAGHGERNPERLAHLKVPAAPCRGATMVRTTSRQPSPEEVVHPRMAGMLDERFPRRCHAGRGGARNASPSPPLPRTAAYRRRLRTYTVMPPAAEAATAPSRAIHPSGGPPSGSGAGGGGGGADVGVGSGVAVGVGVAVGGAGVGVAVGSGVGVGVGGSGVGVDVGSGVGVDVGSGVGVDVGSGVGVCVGSGVGVCVGSGVGVCVGSGVGVCVGSGVGVGGGPTLMLESPATASSALFTSRSIPEKE